MLSIETPTSLHTRLSMNIISQLRFIGLIFTLAVLALPEARSQVLTSDIGATISFGNGQHCCAMGQELLYSKPMVVMTGYSTPELPHLRIVSNGVLYFAGPSVKLSVTPSLGLSDINVSGGSGLVTFPIITKLQ